MKFNEETPINRFHNCVLIKIHTTQQSREKLKVLLTYRFGVHEYLEPQTNNYISFGITMGKLVLDCHNIIFPEEDKGFGEPFSYEYSFHETEEDSVSQKSIWEISLKRIFEKSLELLVNRKQEETQGSKYTRTYDRQIYTTWTEGTEQTPVIGFDCKTNIRSYLRGKDSMAKIGIATIFSQDWSIEAFFKIDPSNIRIIKFNQKTVENLNWIERCKFRKTHQNLLREIREIGCKISCIKISSA